MRCAVPVPFFCSGIKPLPSLFAVSRTDVTHRADAVFLTPYLEGMGTRAKLTKNGGLWSLAPQDASLVTVIVNFNHTSTTVMNAAPHAGLAVRDLNWNAIQPEVFVMTSRDEPASWIMPTSMN